MEFKFQMGAMVRGGPCILCTQRSVRGEVIARTELKQRCSYKIQVKVGDGVERVHEVVEKSLRLISDVPSWLRPGVEIQWMGRGVHLVYVVEKINREGKYRPWTFTAFNKARRDQIYSECVPENMKFWRRYPGKSTHVQSFKKML